MTKITLVLLGLFEIFSIFHVLAFQMQIQVNQLCDSHQSFCEKCESQNVNCRNLYENCGAIFKKAEAARLNSKSFKSTLQLSLCRQLRSHCNSCRRQGGKCEKHQVQCSNFKEYTSLLKSKAPPKLKSKVNQLCQMSGEMCAPSSFVNCCTGFTCQLQRTQTRIRQGQQQRQRQKQRKVTREEDEKVERNLNTDKIGTESGTQKLGKSFPIGDKATRTRKNYALTWVCVQAFSMDVNVNENDNDDDDENDDGDGDGADRDTDMDQVLNEHHFDGSEDKEAGGNDDGDGEVGIKGHDHNDKTRTCQKMGEPCSTPHNLQLTTSLSSSSLLLLPCCPGFRCTIDLTSPSNGNYSDPQWRLKNSFCSMENGKNEAQELMAELMGKKRPK